MEFSHAAAQWGEERAAFKQGEAKLRAELASIEAQLQLERDTSGQLRQQLQQADAANASQHEQYVTTARSIEAESGMREAAAKRMLLEAQVTFVIVLVS